MNTAKVMKFNYFLSCVRGGERAEGKFAGGQKTNRKHISTSFHFHTRFAFFFFVC